MARIDTDSLVWGGILGAAYIAAPEADKALGRTGQRLSVKNAVEIGAPVAGILMQAFNFRPDMGVKLTRAGTAMAVKSLYEMFVATGVTTRSSARTVAAHRVPATAAPGDYDIR